MAFPTKEHKQKQGLTGENHRSNSGFSANHRIVNNHETNGSQSARPFLPKYAFAEFDEKECSSNSYLAVKNMQTSLAKNKIGSEIIADVESLPDFVIPVLPSGNTLKVNIKTTWGDRHYVGLNGIEMFNKLGNKVIVEEVNINISIAMGICIKKDRFLLGFFFTSS